MLNWPDSKHSTDYFFDDCCLSIILLLNRAALQEGAGFSNSWSRVRWLWRLQTSLF